MYILCLPRKNLNRCFDACTLYFVGSGVYFGQLDFNPLDSCDNITAETKLLQYPFFTNSLLHMTSQYYKPINCGIIASILLLCSEGCLCCSEGCLSYKTIERVVYHIKLLYHLMTSNVLNDCVI